MSYQHPMILFVGSPEQGTELLNAVEPMGWWVYQPETANDALGMYVGFLPDVVVMDASVTPEAAEEVYFHLASIEADPMIVLGGDSVWSDRVTHHLPADARITEIIGCVAEVTEAEWQPEASR